MKKRIIGIDFGTSSTVIKIKDYVDGKELHQKEFKSLCEDNGDNNPIIPSLIFEKPDGKIVAYGVEARNYPGEGVLLDNFKMDLLSGANDELTRVSELIENFYCFVYKLYKDQYHFFGEKPDKEETIISYPVKWPSEIRNKMICIAKKAGFKNVKGMDEPTAAINSALYFYHQELIASELVKYKEASNILMIDMGAGTTDIVYYSYTVGKEKPVSNVYTWPPVEMKESFGGKEFDEYLTNSAINYIRKYRDNFGANNVNLISHLRMQMKGWKEKTLSKALSNDEMLKKIPMFFYNYTDYSDEYEYIIKDRTSFEDYTSELMNTFPKLILDFSEFIQTKLNKNIFDEVDVILLTGGNSKWYFIEEYLTGKRISHYGSICFGKIHNESNRLMRMPKPHESVAMGLCLNEDVLNRINSDYLYAKDEREKKKFNESIKNKKDNSKSEKDASNTEISSDKIVYKKAKDLQIVVNILNESAIALENPNRVTKDSSMSEIISKAAESASFIGTTLSVGGLVGLGTTGLSIVGITSAATAAGSFVGGGIIAGAFVLAAPIAILGVGGGIIANQAKKKALKQLISEKEKLVPLIKEYTVKLKIEIESKNISDEERKEYLMGLYVLLYHAKKEVLNDLELHKEKLEKKGIGFNRK